MAEAAGMKFKLTAGKGMPGAPTFHCEGTMEPNHTIQVAKAEITQALPPPNGVTPIERAQGKWAEEVMGQEEGLLMSITGEVQPRKDQPLEEKFASEFRFPHKGPPKAGETLKGTGFFMQRGQKVSDVPAELQIL